MSEVFHHKVAEKLPEKARQTYRTYMKELTEEFKMILIFETQESQLQNIQAK